MAHSTTTTTSYVLSKYSRSYPTAAQTYTDWKHFTNPEIRLVLDVTKSDSSDLQEVRLRVLWNINDASDNQPQVVFEDIELLSFSTLAMDKVLDKNQQLQSLPIKAVYRENLVGIRYLYPKDSINSDPTYRRFQVTFGSIALTNEFINSICTVCPCKLNPMQVPSRNLLPKTWDLPQSTSNAPGDFNVPMPPRPAPITVTGLSQQEKDISLLTSSPANIYSDHSQSCNTQDSRSQLGHLYYHEIGTGINRSQQRSQLSSQEKKSKTQPPGSPSKGDERPETAHDKIRHEFLSSLQEFQNTELYDLSPDALEEIVGGIVHEKGFPELLKSLEKLWAIKDLAKIYM